MRNALKITTCVALVIVFAALFHLAIEWNHDLPQISLCCEIEGLCDDLETITSKQINSNWKTDIKYKVVRNIPQCSDHSHNWIFDFVIKKNGQLAFTESSDEKVTCNVHEYCLDTSNPTVFAKVCLGSTCSARSKISSLWLVNLIAVPCVLMTIFVYIFLDKIGKDQTKYLLFYVIHLVLLHVCLAVTKIFMNELNNSNFCDPITYASYYSLLACFAWLITLCHNVRRSLSFASDVSVESGASLQGGKVKHQETQERFYFYCLFALGLPTIITILISVIDTAIDAKDFGQCSRLQYSEKAIKFDYVFLPIAIIMTCGIILYAETKSQLARTIQTVTNISSGLHNSLQEERKRFMIYWRLFLVMLVSWVFFIFFDALRPHVVTIMNVLHLIALVSLLNAAMQSPSALIQRVRTMASRQQSEVDTSQTIAVPPAQRPMLGWTFDS